MPVTTIMTLPTEMCMEIVFQLPPRHIYKLMQTNQRFRKLCMSEKYWRRVALHLMWGKMCPEAVSSKIPSLMVCMRRSYKAVMDEFIVYFRNRVSVMSVYMNEVATKKAETLLPSIDGGSASLEQLLAWAQKHVYVKDLYGQPLFVYGETALQFTRRLILDEAGVPSAIENVESAGGIPAATGFMTSARYGNKLSLRFLHALDDDGSMSLESKLCMREAVVDLLRFSHSPTVYVSGAATGTDSYVANISDELCLSDLSILQDKWACS